MPNIKLVIASTNPVKAKASEDGLREIPDFTNYTFQIQSVKVDSGVSDQPRSNNETLLGALNRAKNAQAINPNADYWIGLEGGVEDRKTGGMWSIVWAVILDKLNNLGRAQPGTYRIPDEIAELIRGGMELGTADDIVFKKHNSKQGDGSVGILTHGGINRAGYYKLAVTLAAIPLINPDLYTPENIDHLIGTLQDESLS